MGSLFNINLLGFFLLCIIAIQANPVLESSKSSESNNSSKNKQQLYEIYKTMRADPRLNSVSNNDLVSFIYRNFVDGNKINMNLIKQKFPNQQQQQQQTNVE